MSPDPSPIADEPIEPCEGILQLRLSDYLWHPWYAKLWWIGIPIYWAGVALSLRVSALAAFYDAALAGYLNVLFLPMTALIVLGFGYARAWLDRAQRLDEDEEFRFGRAVGVPPPEIDILDPRSGFLWINHPRNREKRQGR